MVFFSQHLWGPIIPVKLQEMIQRNLDIIEVAWEIPPIESNGA